MKKILYQAHIGPLADTISMANAVKPIPPSLAHCLNLSGTTAIDVLEKAKELISSAYWQSLPDMKTMGKYKPIWNKQAEEKMVREIFAETGFQ